MDSGRAYIEFIPIWKANLVSQKIQEVLRRIKKPIRNAVNREVIEKQIKQGTAQHITGIEVDKTGSVWTYISGHKEPVRCFADHDTVVTTAIYKRLLPLIASNLSKMGYCRAFITLLAMKFNFNILPEWFDVIFNNTECRLRDEYYCTPVKEIRRVLNGRINEMLLDGGTLLIEADSVYRYRFQDFISELNKDNLKGYFSTIKEISRILGIWITREDVPVRQSKFSKIKKLAVLALIVNPQFVKTLSECLKELDLEKIRMNASDKYWSGFINNYSFAGIGWNDRKTIIEKINE